MRTERDLSIFDALQPCALLRNGKLLTGLHLREALIAGPEPHDRELAIAPGVIPDDLIVTERESLSRALLRLDLRLPKRITDRRECTPVLRSAARRFKTIEDPKTGKNRTITVGDIWQMDVQDFGRRVAKNFSKPGKPVFTRPLSISPSPEEYWIAPFLLRRPTAMHSCLKWYKHPLDLHFSHDPGTFLSGRVTRTARISKCGTRIEPGRIIASGRAIKSPERWLEKQELTFRVATQTVCHRRNTEEYQAETKTYLDNAEENRKMVASGGPAGPSRRTIPAPNLHDPDRRLIVDWPEPRYRGYTEEFDSTAIKVVGELLKNKGQGRNPGLRDALLDECVRIAGAEQELAPKDLYSHLYDRLRRKFFSAEVSDALDIMLDGHLVTKQTEFRERTDEKSGAITVEMAIETHNEESIDKDDSVSVDDLSARLRTCLDVESGFIKGVKLLPIALALAEKKTEVEVAVIYGCDQPQISRAKREIRDRLRANGYRK
jgi:hypothetical protein